MGHRLFSLPDLLTAEPLPGKYPFDIMSTLGNNPALFFSWCPHVGSHIGFFHSVTDGGCRHPRSIQSRFWERLRHNGSRCSLAPQRSPQTPI